MPAVADQIVGLAKWRDQGDGSFAEIVAVTGFPGSASVPVTFPRTTSVILNDSRSLVSTGGASADLAVGASRELAVDVNLTQIGGTGPTITFKLSRKGADGIYYAVWTSAAMSAVGVASTSVGMGATTPASFGDIVQWSWTIAGVSPTASWTASIKGTS